MHSQKLWIEWFSWPNTTVDVLRILESEPIKVDFSPLTEAEAIREEGFLGARMLNQMVGIRVSSKMARKC